MATLDPIDITGNDSLNEDVSAFFVPVTSGNTVSYAARYSKALASSLFNFDPKADPLLQVVAVSTIAENLKFNFDSA